MNKEKLESHVAELVQRQKELDKKIKEGYTHYLADENLNKMKQEKAHVKRQIETIQEQLKAI